MKRILTLFLVLSLLLLLVSCGNQDIFDTNYTMEYIVIFEGGRYVLHTVKSWSDSESDSVTVTTGCCENYIWTSVNNATLYKSKPAETVYTHACGQ